MFRNVPTGNNMSTSNYNYSNHRGGSGGGGGRFRGRGRGGRRGGFNSRRPNQQDPTKRGLFSDGIWLCNCTPRLPAEHFKVKKEGPNKGRWFYTCQNSEGRRCDFFLWDEDAKPREEAAVLSGKRDEPRATPGVYENAGGRNVYGDSMVEETQLRQNITSQTSTQSQSMNIPAPVSHGIDTHSPMTLGRTPISTAHNAISNKRSLGDAGFDFDDDDADSFPWDLTGKEADELEERASHAPETPRKAIKSGPYATPATTGKRQLPWLDYTTDPTAEDADRAPATPSKPGNATSIPTPSHTKPVSAGQTDTTLSNSRFRDALAESANSSLTDEVFGVLRSSSTTIPSDVATQVRAILNKHDLKTQGVVRGREMVRLALKARDAKVVELNARIAALEAEREVDRARIRGLRLKDSMLG